MTSATEFAPAKINLALHVTGQQANGYHVLDSLVVFADVGDVLSVLPTAQTSLTVGGPFAEGVPEDAGNLVWKALDRAGVTAKVSLTKNLPHGAGIGGGSSDAAAILRVIKRPDLALDLGADVPVCLGSAPQRMQGIGDILTAVPDFPAFWLVLVNPGAHVPTVDVFNALSSKHNSEMDAMPEDGDWLGWLAAQRNDLQEPACTYAPVVAEALMALGDASLTRMSGSGSTCFGVYPDQSSARAAQARISAAYPDWWVVATQTYGAVVS